LKRLDLSNNAFTGVIPSLIGQLQGASVLLKGIFFHTNTTAPLSLCVLIGVEEFDLADNATFCPTEQNALSDFYDSAKGSEWTDRTDWKDEYASYCDWKGVAWDDENHVTKLNLTNNGLSGRLSKSIGNLSFIEVLDLSDNDVKVMSILVHGLSPFFICLTSFIANSFKIMIPPSWSRLNTHRDRFRLRLACFPTSLICVSATIRSQERHLQA
jgi:hypothetical protein